MTTVVREPRIYGNWRRPRSPGIWGFGALAVVILLAGTVLAIALMLRVDRWAGLGVMGLVLVVVLPMRVKDRYGRDLWQVLVAKVAWRLGVAKGQHLYQSGPLARHGAGTYRLPGIAAPITAYEAFDGWHRPFGLLHHPTADHVTAVVQTYADGGVLLDDDELDGRVSQWGAWLASLAYEPGLVGVAVTVESAPDAGVRLRREVEGHLVDDAPPLAAEMLRAVVDQYPAGSATIACRIALTWSMHARVEGCPRRSVAEMAVEIATRLPQVTRSLGGTGAGPGRPMTVTEIATACRVAYDPHVHPVVEELGAANTGIAFVDCGPKAAFEFDSYYLHDGAASVSWEMGVAPRGFVTSQVLTGLLAPHPAVDRKRVTLLYRLHDPAAAAEVVEKDYRDAVFTKGGSKGLQAQASLEVRQAEKTASEEAQGAGLVRCAMIVTATMLEESALEQAAVVVQDLGLGARLTLRRATGSQASTFAAGLPLGLVLPHHLQVPQGLRELR